MIENYSIWEKVIYNGCKAFEAWIIKYSILKHDLTLVPDTFQPEHVCNVHRRICPHQDLLVIRDLMIANSCRFIFTSPSIANYRYFILFIWQSIWVYSRSEKLYVFFACHIYGRVCKDEFGLCFLWNWGNGAVKRKYIYVNFFKLFFQLAILV